MQHCICEADLGAQPRIQHLACNRHPDTRNTTLCRLCNTDCKPRCYNMKHGLNKVKTKLLHKASAATTQHQLWKACKRGRNTPASAFQLLLPQDNPPGSCRREQSRHAGKHRPTSAPIGQMDLQEFPPSLQILQHKPPARVNEQN